MAVAHPRECRECGVAFTQTGRGRPAQRCPECAPNRDPGRKITPENLERLRLARAAGKAGERANEAAADFRNAQRLAFALSLYPDAETAAKAARLDLSPEDLARCAALARSQHAGLAGGDVSELAKIAGLNIHLYLCQLQDSVGRVPPAQIPFVLRGLAQVRQDLSPDLQHNYGQVTVVVRGPEPKDPA